MGVEWSGVAPNLLVVLDRAAGRPLGRQLQDELRTAIRTGRLTAGERLPATRVLAHQLGVSRGLVVDAYAQLESEGYLESQVGSGTQVAAGATGPAAPARRSTPSVRRPDIDFE